MATKEDVINIIKQRTKEGQVNSKDVNKNSLKSEDAVDKLIKERKPYRLNDYIREVSSNPPNTLGQQGDNLLSAMKLLGEPFIRGEAAAANTGLSLQSGQFDPRKLGSEFIRGVKGEKLGELGDISRRAGRGEIESAATGFVAGLVTPLAVFGRTLKNVSKISKSTDKGLKVAGKLLANAADDATNIYNKALNKAYQSVVKVGRETKMANDVAVDGTKVIDSVSKLDKKIIRFLEGELGTTIDDFLLDFNIKKARKLKGLIGDFRPGSFSKAEKGANELVTDKLINKAYGAIKKSMADSLGGEYKKILDADEKITDAINASRFIKRKITDPVLLETTRAGNIAKGLLSDSDLSTRAALNIIKKAGGDAFKNINKSQRILDSFNRKQAIKNASISATKAAVYGGAAGAAGGKVFQSVGGDDK